MQSFGWIRNPLSIVALFISLIYGMSALLFGTSVARLSPGNQSVMVWFIVIFPFAVLGVFAWLVAKHHQKLYGPSDYRSEDVFASTFQPATAKEIARKLEADVKTQHEEAAEGSEIAGREGAVIKPGPLQFKIKSEAIRSAYILENLALQRLEREIKAPLLRNVKLAEGQVVDGIWERGASLTIIEVKVLRRGRSPSLVLRGGQRVLSRAKQQLIHSEKSVHTLLVLIIEDDSAMQDVHRHISRSGEGENPDRTRVYRASELLKQFGDILGSSSTGDAN
ncbi:hypothetical protein [Tardiphaga robiniae]|uniref:hypothetical protein n=1 Tax=Tardiphaga robiniae TaxID=943830 RepID=UPI0015863174|nr:hypothetical protein [Tardiphaga robiniae]NUU43066.1 hypothetical protein [Tardiphaga robiniae]